MHKAILFLLLVTIGAAMVGCSPQNQIQAQTKQGAMTPDGKKGGNATIITPSN